MRRDAALFVASALFLFGLGCFLAGVYVGKKRLPPYRQLADIAATLKAVVTDREAQALALHLQPARGPEAGVTVGAGLDDGALILVSSFYDNNNEIRLIRRDGTPVARWPADYFTLFPDRAYLTMPPQTTLNVDIHGMALRPNGDLVFNFDYAGMVALSRCGDVLWTLPEMTHHSVEFAEGGGFWTFGRNRLDPGDDRLAPFSGPAWEDVILRVSDHGRVEREIALVAPLIAGDGLALMTATGGRAQTGDDRELIHPNKVGELPAGLAAAYPMFAAGDLIVSERTFNLVFVLDPATGIVKWRQTGPYLRQHDPEFGPDGRIVLFNNNAFETAAGTLPAPGTTIVSVDPASGESEVLYGDRPGEEMFSTIRGKVDRLPAGGLLIAEFEGGRVIEVDAARRKIWEYVNRYDADRVAEITEARLFPPGYFTVADWSCP